MVILLVFLTGCSSNQIAVPTETLNIVQTPSLSPLQTAIPPTETLIPTSTSTLFPTATPPGGGGGKIAFTSERDGYAEIYIMNPDGSEQTPLTNGITPKYNPAWSPDGTKIAFATHNDDFDGLYVMNADGSNPLKLIDTKDIDVYDQVTPEWRFVAGCCTPVWSPDGTKIAFKVIHYIGCCFMAGHLHMINADGSYLSSVKIPPWESPVWSPDSQKIAFGGNCDDDVGICVMDAEGANPVRLAPGGSPAWSPAGDKIAVGGISVMNADGTNLVNLRVRGGSPVWSPDGNKIAFGSSTQVGTVDLYVMNADGTNPTILTNHEVNNWNQVWSPDSTKIAFISERDGDQEIYMISVDGSNLVQLTNNKSNDYSPVWSP